MTGLKDTVDVQSIFVDKTRYGVRSTLFECKDKQELNIEPVSPPEGILLIRKSSLSPPISFSAKLYTPFPFIRADSDLFKIRIDCGFFEIVSTLAEGRVDFTLNLEKQETFNIKKAVSLTRFLLNSCTQDEEILFAFESNSDKSDISKSLTFSLQTNQSHSNPLKEAHQALDCIYSVLGFFGSDQDIEIPSKNFDQIVSQAEKISQLISSKPVALRFDFEANGVLCDEKETAVIFMVGMQIKNQTYAIVMVAEGQATEIENGHYELVTTYISEKNPVILFNGDVMQQQELSKMVDEIINKHLTQRNVVNLIGQLIVEL